VTIIKPKEILSFLKSLVSAGMAAVVAFGLFGICFLLIIYHNYFYKEVAKI
jgi:hypothetical protein